MSAVSLSVRGAQLRAGSPGCWGGSTSGTAGPQNRGYPGGSRQRGAGSGFTFSSQIHALSRYFPELPSRLRTVKPTASTCVWRRARRGGASGPTASLFDGVWVWIGPRGLQLPGSTARGVRAFAPYMQIYLRGVANPRARWRRHVARSFLSLCASLSFFGRHLVLTACWAAEEPPDSVTAI